MDLWMDVTSADGTRQGAGPIKAITAATVNRVMDGIGTWSANVSAANARNLDLLVHGAYVVIYGRVRGVIRELGGGQITDVTRKDAPDGAQMQIAGLDRLDDLKRISTLIGRHYHGEPIGVIVYELVSLAGWTVTNTATGATSINYDGVSVLKALQTLAENTGQHLRLIGNQAIEFGALGADTGLRLVQRRSLSSGAYANQAIAFVRSIQLKQTRKDVINWILPLGKKDQDPRVTLAYSTRSTPYAIQSVIGPSGDTLYYLADAASVAAYGLRQDVRAWSDIEAASSAPADMTSAANALYDAAAAELARASQHQDVYSLEIAGATSTIRPGDQVRIVYSGAVQVDGREARYMDIDDLFYVLSVTETVGSEGASLSIEASNVDRQQSDAAAVVAKTVSKVNTIEV